MSIIDTVSIILACVAAVLGWDFVRMYRKEPWRDYEAGRHLMRFTVGVAVITTWSVGGLLLRWLFPDIPWLETVLSLGRSLIFGWLAIMLYSRRRLLLEHLRERRLEAESRTTGTEPERNPS